MSINGASKYSNCTVVIYISCRQTDRDRERERERDRETDTQTDRERDRQTHVEQ